MQEILNKLAELGWIVTNSYADGVVRMEKDGDGGKVCTFVRSNGTLSTAKSWPTTVATMSLREAFGNRVA